MTIRGRLALLFGAGVYLAAWAFGSKALYPVAVGLLVAVALAWIWAMFAGRPVRLTWGSRRREHVEGDDVQIEIDAELDGGLLPLPSAALFQRIRGLGERTTPLECHDRVLTARYVVECVPRGRYVLEEARAVFEDPFGLERFEVELKGGATLLVYPRLAELDGLFSDGGAAALDGRRVLLHRPSGFDLHSVREYEEGESLRRVHWPSTAKRGQLMVRELEDSPRDEVAVLLDASVASLGQSPDSSFDLQVRAAGSILLAQTKRNRRALLAVAGGSLDVVHVTGDGDWAKALELLAAAEPAGRMSAAAALAAEGGPVSGPLETVVVTSALTPALADRLLERSQGRRRVSLVYVDAQSFGSVEGAAREPGLLRLQAARIPVAVLRRGDDLASVLGGQATAVAASG